MGNTCQHSMACPPYQLAPFYRKNPGTFIVLTRITCKGHQLACPPCTCWPEAALLPVMLRLKTMWERELCSLVAVAPTARCRMARASRSATLPGRRTSTPSRKLTDVTPLSSCDTCWPYQQVRSRSSIQAEGVRSRWIASGGGSCRVTSGSCKFAVGTWRVEVFDSVCVWQTQAL